MTHCSSSSNNRSRSREQKATHNSISIRGESTKQLLELSLWTKLYWDTHQSQIPDLTWQLWWVPSFINILSCNLFIPQQPESVFLESSVNSLQNQVCLPAQAWFYRLFKNHLHLPEVVCIHLVSKYPSCELGGGKFLKTRAAGTHTTHTGSWILSKNKGWANCKQFTFTFFIAGSFWSAHFTVVSYHLELWQECSKS